MPRTYAQLLKLAEDNQVDQEMISELRKKLNPSLFTIEQDFGKTALKDLKFVEEVVVARLNEDGIADFEINRKGANAVVLRTFLICEIEIGADGHKYAIKVFARKDDFKIVIYIRAGKLHRRHVSRLK